MFFLRYRGLLPFSPCDVNGDAIHLVEVDRILVSVSISTPKLVKSSVLVWFRFW